MKEKKNTKKKIEKETRNLKMMFVRSGRGTETPRMTFPMVWIKDMGIDLNERDLEVTYHPRTKKISIRKKSSETSTDDSED